MYKKALKNLTQWDIIISSKILIRESTSMETLKVPVPKSLEN